MIKIDWKRLIRSREWLGFKFIVCEFSDSREWGWNPGRGSIFMRTPGTVVFRVIGFLNKHA